MVEPPDEEPPRTALVLDDELQIGALVCKVLGSVGIAGKQFTDPLEFLLEVKRMPRDLLVIDLKLERSDAVDVIRKLDVLRFRGQVLLISGRDEATLREIERVGRSHGLRMLPSLQKPFRAGELKERVKAPFDHAAAQSGPDKAAEQPPENPGALLEQALQGEWLEVWYQPKLELENSAICGAEALIRARDANGRLLLPAQLLPPPGDPLYKTLTLFVIRRAVSDWKLFVNKGFPLQLAINVPASILSAPGFVGFMREILPDHPKFPGLVVEVTEDEAIRDMGWIHEVATQLRLYNVWTSIDDFGSAYASLSRLKDLPFYEVKLDRGFVLNCASDALKRGLCQTVADLAHFFEASACAEGVENLDDLRCLKEIGFNTAQGFLFAHAMPAAEFLEFLAKWKVSPPDFLRSVSPSNTLRSAKA